MLRYQLTDVSHEATSVLPGLEAIGRPIATAQMKFEVQFPRYDLGQLQHFASLRLEPHS
jgi:hypothetical protein